MSDPADINDRLEAAAEKAEGASEIMRRFSNDPAGTYITTESGPLPSLAEWLALNEGAMEGVPELHQFVEDLQVDDATGKGADLVGYKGRTAADRLADVASVKDSPFLTVGDGVANDSTTLQAAVNSISPGASGVFIIPPGNYKLNEDVVQNGRHVTFIVDSGAAFTGAGSLEVNYVRYDAYGASYGKSRHAFGSNVDGGGLLIGGGAIDEGGHGTYLANDGHGNWMRVQTSTDENPVEIVVYGAAGQGRAISVNATAFIDRVEGSPFKAAWVDRPFYFLRKKYLVKAFVSADRIELKQVDGSPVSFTSAQTAAYHFVMTTGSGTCNVSGTTVTRVEGQPFVPFISTPGFVFKLNGTQVTVSAFTDSNTLTLSAAPGNATGVSYFYELDINGQISTLRLQKTLGDTEENFTVSARADGVYEMRAGAGGNGEYYPIRTYNGVTGPFTPRPVTVVNEAGRFGVSNSQLFSPAVLSEVLSIRPEALGTNLYEEFMRVGTVWNDTDIRGMEFGNYGNGTQGGYIQGRDYSGSLYDIVLNPRGGNVGIGVNNPGLKLAVAGNIGFSVDNLYSFGVAGGRATSVWAVNGTIQTSDITLKTDIQVTPLGLDFIMALEPIAYRFIVGGVEPVEVPDGFDEVVQPVMVTEVVDEPYQDVEIIDGRKVLVTKFREKSIERQVFDVVDDLHDWDGQLLPPTKVPRYETIKVPRFRTEYRDVEGKRLHHGFSAQAVKALCDEMGVDFGGHVIGEDGLHGLRYEQFIAPLVLAFHQHVKRSNEKIEALQQALEKLQSN